MHQISQTGKTTLEGKTFELELSPHHQGQTYKECEEDCPQGWQVPTYWLLQSLRNNSQTRDQFGLLNAREYVQNPDNISKQNGYVARFSANSDWADLVCNRDPTVRSPFLRVRYVREISEESTLSSIPFHPSEREPS